jgi:UDP-3-O-[3-hydroxymyristoyl] glucosamine N-acyltransferase
MAPTLGELAQRFKAGLPELTLVGDPDAPIRGICTLDPGEPGCLAFLANPRLRGALATTRAAAVILSPRDVASFKGNGLVAKDPHLAYARIASAFDDSRNFRPGVDPTAAVAAGVKIPATSHVGACSAIAGGAVIGANVYIGAGCVIGADARIGDGSRLDGRVYVGDRVRVGKRARLGPGAVVGGRGFGLARGPGGWEEVPQLGSVVLGDDVEVGANSTIDRGAIGDTVIEDGVKLDNLIQIAHNVRVGAHTVMAAMSGIAGSARVGARCMIGGCTCINGHIEVADDVVILGFSAVIKGIPEKGQYGGIPCVPARQWRRRTARVERLAATEERLAAIERRLGIEQQADGEDDGGQPDV